MDKLSIRDLALPGKRVFIRVDFNVPLAPGGEGCTNLGSRRGLVIFVEQTAEEVSPIH